MKLTLNSSVVSSFHSHLWPMLDDVIARFFHGDFMRERCKERRHFNIISNIIMDLLFYFVVVTFESFLSDTSSSSTATTTNEMRSPPGGVVCTMTYSVSFDHWIQFNSINRGKRENDRSAQRGLKRQLMISCVNVLSLPRRVALTNLTIDRKCERSGELSRVSQHEHRRCWKKRTSSKRK